MTEKRAIVPITEAEFRAAGGGRHVPRHSEESSAIRALAVGEGFKVPCHWRHNSTGSCGGVSIAHSVAKKHSMKVQTRCKDGVLYVFRVA